MDVINFWGGCVLDGNVQVVCGVVFRFLLLSVNSGVAG